jgi:hypothetical protein
MRDMTMAEWVGFSKQAADPVTLVASALDMPPSTGASNAMLVSFDIRRLSPDEQQQHEAHVYWQFRGKRSYPRGAKLRRSCMRLAVLACASLLAARMASSQDLSDRELARQLSNDATQRDAVAKVVAAGTARVPLLLSWSARPPADLTGMSEYFLDIALADIFAELRTKEAIPFLAENIGMPRWPYMNPSMWRQSPQMVIEEMPAVAALIRIGHEALPRVIAVTRAPLEPSSYEDYLAAVFVAPRIAVTTEDKKTVRDFLTAMLVRSNALPTGGAHQLSYWAQDGLEFLSKFERPLTMPWHAVE